MVLMQNNLRMLKKSVKQDRRELGDRSVPLRLLAVISFVGYVAGRRATENAA